MSKWDIESLDAVIREPGAGGALVQSLAMQLKKMIIEESPATVNLTRCDFDSIMEDSGEGEDYCNGYADGVYNVVTHMHNAGVKYKY